MPLPSWKSHCIQGNKPANKARTGGMVLSKANWLMTGEQRTATS
jgi:hypothetical protein